MTLLRAKARVRLGKNAGNKHVCLQGKARLLAEDEWAWEGGKRGDINTQTQSVGSPQILPHSQKM